ncbi:MAG TPA: hypothetical protein VF444_09015 [Pseudonocardiaceae bacterium]
MAKSSEPQAEVRAMFSDAELAELAANKLKHGDDKPDALGHARAWEIHVEKIDNDRALPWGDHSVWTEHDLAAAMFIRDFVEDDLRQLRPGLAEKVRRYVTRTDERFKSFTVEDSGQRMGQIAGVRMTGRGMEGRGWWWFRVPTSGPIVRDLAWYDTHGF